MTGADIVYSDYDGGWWVELWKQDKSASLPHGLDKESPTFATREEAENWARKNGAIVLLYP